MAAAGIAQVDARRQGLAPLVDHMDLQDSRRLRFPIVRGARRVAGHGREQCDQAGQVHFLTSNGFGLSVCLPSPGPLPLSGSFVLSGPFGLTAAFSAAA